MQSLQSIKSRSRAVKNIGQITKAMEVVAATKMRKSQEVALKSRPYAFKALQLLSVLAKNALPILENQNRGSSISNQNNNFEEIGTINSELMAKRHVKKTLLVIVTSDRGLAGSFNSQVLRLADSFLKSYKETGPDNGLQAMAVGKKAISYVSKKRLESVGSFSGFGDFIEPAETAGLSDKVISGFLKGDFDRVMTISTHFRSTLKQEVLIRQVLPVDLEKIKQAIVEIVPEHGRFSELRNSLTTNYLLRTTDYIFEPSPKELVESLVHHLVGMEMYHLVLEANASEHSARMVAMKTASDNAKELSENLNLEYNKARQAGITKELIEITSAIQTLS